MRERPILIAYRRFEQLQELLFARGYLIDPSGRDPNEWRDDPPFGLVRLKGVALKGEGEEAEPDHRITFSITEFWSIERVEGAHREHGYWLAGYSYHGQVGDVSLRYCFDPQRHPEMPYPAILRAVKAASHGDMSVSKKRSKASMHSQLNSGGPGDCRPSSNPFQIRTIEGVATAGTKEAIHVRATGHLSDRDIASATGAAPSTVRDWVNGDIAPSGGHADRLAELCTVVERLAPVIRPTYISAWLNQSMDLLDDDKPIERIAAGDHHAVARLISGLEDPGRYLKQSDFRLSHGPH